MADIYGGFDFMAAGNALSQMQDARQKQQYNAMLMQNTMEDRARADQARKVAAGNALAERAALSKALENSVVGMAGPEQPNLGNAQNALAMQGRFGAATAISNIQEQFAKQKEQEAKAAGQGLTNVKTSAETAGVGAENVKKFIELQRMQIDAAPDIQTIKAITAASYAPGHPLTAFHEQNGVTLEKALAGIDALAAQGKTVDQIRAQMSQGATAAAKNFADLSLTEAQTGSATANTAKIEAETAAAEEKRTAPIPKEMDAGGTTIIYDSNPLSKTHLQILKSVDKTLTPAETATNTAAAEKLAYERANPGFTIADSASGKVRINKVTGEVTPLTLNGQTLMPYVKPDPNAVALTPQALDVAAHTYILTGVLPPGMGKNSTEIRTQIMNHATELANGRSAEQFAQDLRVNRNDTAAMKNATTAFGTGTQGKMVNSFNTAIDHLETINDLVAALQNNDTKRINSVSNAIASEFGVAAPANFEAAKQLVSSEIVKAINSSGGALADRQEAESALSLANSPEQLKGVVDTFQKLLGGQLKSLELQYTNMTGKKDFSAKLTDKAKIALGRVGGDVKNTTTLPAADNAGQPNSGATSTAVDAANPLFLLEPGAN